ncbi:class I SAM-dependent methyltransferase [Pyxidicoccus fallax]|uniref:Class I SAM-dependent methyltransferase n=1 Tax=Pyxidicoccus fallax TaxID=394095 RepID=A0A848LWV1_9BACT|nr:class I SAM-dependent methyltransferase [Pyxidicoccus fallax]NMO22618.1 class I SAM-dependent methyltransferase [Pyxidicoccus fallax]NPC84648.1 class I SAM-dependent methyltransferase [Pyxidicoccus fallax]
MSVASPLAVPEPWDLVAPEYVRELMPVFETFSRDALARADVGQGTRVVDVAAGPGTLALLAAERGARVTAVDFSARMIGALREHAAARRLEIESLVGDGMAMALPDRAFDAAFSMFGLMFFPDRARGFRELHRVLVPAGRAVVSSWVPMERSPAMNVVYKSFAELMTANGGGGGAPRDGMMPLSDPETCRREMAGAGFVDVAVHEVSADARYASTAALVDAMARSSAPVVLARKALGEKWGGFERAFLEKVTAELGTGPQVCTFNAYLTVGTRR